jgi:hypothetical protein
MAFYTFEQLINAPTTDEIKKSIYDALIAMGVTATNWKPGAVVRTMIAGCAIVLAALASLIVLVNRGGFLSLSEGPWKKLVAKYSYNVNYLEASFAIGPLNLTNAGGGIYPFGPKEYTVRNAETGALYENQSAFTLNGLSTLQITIQALEAGSASSALAGQISETVTTLPDVTVNNPVALVGRDEESDTELDARAGEKLGSLSPNGPWDAYSFIAKSAKRADGSSIGISRVNPVKEPNGHATIYVATPSGGVTGAVNDLNSDLGIVDELIQTQCVPLGFTAETASAEPRAVDGSYAIWIYNTSGAAVSTITTAIDAAIAARLGTVPIGGDKLPGYPNGVHASLIEDVISKAKVNGKSLEIIRKTAALVATPDTSVLALNFNEAPIIGTFTGSVVQISPSGVV